MLNLRPAIVPLLSILRVFMLIMSLLEDDLNFCKWKATSTMLKATYGAVFGL
jgi:hypothetical protein